MHRVTETEYAQMSWHARQRYNDRLVAETRQLQADLDALRRKAARKAARTYAVPADAAAQLAALPVDPQAQARQEHLTAS